jgi:dCMP deaminase
MKAPELLWSDLVKRFAEQSKCRSRRVGAILVDRDGHMFGQGFNGAPTGSCVTECQRCDDKMKESGKDLARAICAHAEANAIAMAARNGRTTKWATLYCTTYPCAECAKAIVGAGITQVVYNEAYPSPLTDSIFKNAGVIVRMNDFR